MSRQAHYIICIDNFYEYMNLFQVCRTKSDESRVLNQPAIKQKAVTAYVIRTTSANCA